MPRNRKAEKPAASPLPSAPVDSKKRKRGQGALQDESIPSPRNTKRTREQAALPNGTEAPLHSPRAKPAAGVTIVDKVDVRVEKDRNGTLAVAEQHEVKITIQKSPARKARGKKATKVESENEQSANEEAAKPERKRKTQEEKDAEAMPLAARTIGSKMFVGAHTSIAKGVENSVTNCQHIGGNAFACFLKSQRKWENPPLQDGNRDAFRKALIEHKYDGTKHVVPHGSYLVNLATEDKDKAKQSYDTFLDDLRRCESLGIRHYNFHPGGAGQSPFNDAITRLANNLNRALSETSTVVPLLENMAGHGTLIGGRFSDLRDVIAQIKPEFKSRIGVCIDTCHAFAAGYDLRSPEAFKKTMQEFDDVVGMQYLKALHLNDSKAPISSHRDLHQNIGLGFLGLRAFHNVMNEARFHGLPLILETPSEKPDPKDPTGKKTIEDKSVWAAEIKLLESLIGMDPEGDVFKSLEKELSEKGRTERQEMQAQFDKKVDKERKKAAKDREKGQKSLSDMFAKAGPRANKAKPNKARRKPPGGDESSDLSDLSNQSENEDGHAH